MLAIWVVSSANSVPTAPFPTMPPHQRKSCFTFQPECLLNWNRRWGFHYTICSQPCVGYSLCDLKWLICKRRHNWVRKTMQFLIWAKLWGVKIWVDISSGVEVWILSRGGTWRFMTTCHICLLLLQNQLHENNRLQTRKIALLGLVDAANLLFFDMNVCRNILPMFSNWSQLCMTDHLVGRSLPMTWQPFLIWQPFWLNSASRT